jgi:hypothetical protein
MPPVQASLPRSVNVSVSLNWQRRGEVLPYYSSARPETIPSLDEISVQWPFGHITRRPALYRIAVIDFNYRWIYIGESERITRRLWDYERLYRSEPQSTSSRLTVLIRKALIRGHPVYLDTASTGKIIIGGSERRIAIGQGQAKLYPDR